MLKEFFKENSEKVNSILSHQQEYLTTFYLRKRNGKQREIVSPQKEYKVLLRLLNCELKKFYNPLEFIHGFIENRSIKTNAQSHLSKSKILRIDLDNFFNTIKKERIANLFIHPIFGINQEKAEILSALCTCKRKLPQGFPTSPIISNLIFHNLDLKLSNLAEENSLTFTRYADDLVFSSTNQKIDNQVLNNISDIIIKNGFKINKDKIKYKGKHRSQIITGIIVNDKLSVRRSYKKQIRTILHNWQKSGYDYAEKKYLNRYWRNRVNGIPKFLYFKIGQPKLLYSLRGKIEFVGFICGRESNEYTKFNSKFNELYNRDFGDK